MFDTIGRSFNLFRACLRVLSMDKELLFFPLFAVIGLLAVMLAYLFVAISIGVFAGLESIGPIIGLSFLFYILAYFVGIFFNSALVFAAHERLTGGDPNIRSGLRGAARCIPSILIWAVIAATVGLILQILSIRSRRSGGVTGIIQRIIVALLGAAWNTLTYFIVPLIVIERSSFLDSFGSSVALVRRDVGRAGDRQHRIWHIADIRLYSRRDCHGGIGPSTVSVWFRWNNCGGFSRGSNVRFHYSDICHSERNI